MSDGGLSASSRAVGVVIKCVIYRIEPEVLQRSGRAGRVRHKVGWVEDAGVGTANSQAKAEGRSGQVDVVAQRKVGDLVETFGDLVEDEVIVTRAAGQGVTARAADQNV